MSVRKSEGEYVGWLVDSCHMSMIICDTVMWQPVEVMIGCLKSQLSHVTAFGILMC